MSLHLVVCTHLSPCSRLTMALVQETRSGAGTVLSQEPPSRQCDRSAVYLLLAFSPGGSRFRVPEPGLPLSSLPASLPCLPSVDTHCSSQAQLKAHVPSKAFLKSR